MKSLKKMSLKLLEQMKYYDHILLKTNGKYFKLH